MTIFQSKLKVFYKICIFLLEMMTLGKNSGWNDVIKTWTERNKNRSRCWLLSYYSLKTYHFLMKIIRFDREMFSLFRRQKISSNGLWEAKIIEIFNRVSIWWWNSEQSLYKFWALLNQGKNDQEKHTRTHIYTDDSS